MNLLLSLPAFHPGYGGPFFSVGALASALASRGHRVGLIASDFPELPVQAAPEGVALFPLKAVRVPLLRSSRILGGRCAVEAVFDEFAPDVVHDNGMWLAQNHWVSRIAVELGIPLLHSPRGCLDPWAMRHRGWKKKLALKLYQRTDLERVSCFHAASELEAESIRRMGLGQPIAVIPNGIELPEAAEDSEHRTSNIERPTSKCFSTKRYALFMGRLHPIKNLPTLLLAWAQVRPEGWRLKLAGSDELAHRSELEQLARDLGIAEQVEFLGPVYGDAKWELIRGASLAFLISHSENFGISAAEALGCGVPVIASKTTPWECLLTEKTGWWVEGDPASVAGALSEALQLEDRELAAMGRRGAAYVKSTFSWDVISECFLEVYEECRSGFS
ncbi:MAG: glycosyltransferase [Kiritimatiellia bacterium]